MGNMLLLSDAGAVAAKTMMTYQQLILRLC